MYKHNDLTGMRFGNLTALKAVGRSKDRHILWECICDCGTTVIVQSNRLTGSHTKSCGCIQKDAVTKHGDCRVKQKSRLYVIWRSMIARCEHPNRKDYVYYGGRGIKVCQEWKRYENFKEWAFANGYDEHADFGKCTIDRIDVDGNYEPSNCRWVDMATQNRNKRLKIDKAGEQHEID